uniref:Uncharacterized protein n=1 Tax=Glossina pallidipes TaxID=7398 RepID=A0A1A9ZEB5_GLOPL
MLGIPRWQRYDAVVEMFTVLSGGSYILDEFIAVKTKANTNIQKQQQQPQSATGYEPNARLRPTFGCRCRHRHRLASTYCRCKQYCNVICAVGTPYSREDSKLDDAAVDTNPIFHFVSVTFLFLFWFCSQMESNSAAVIMESEDSLIRPKAEQH